jgi:5-methylcytosine-specific restriction endonuclease McrBC GTP-binding regulatory subunit McrB
MLFNTVTSTHILQAIKDFEAKGFPNGFGPSSTYDLVYEGKTYPPKAIMAYANHHAEGRKIERYFKGGLGTDCFKAFERNGFDIVKKENKKMHEKLYQLKEEFLDHWPIEKLEQMTLEEYTDTERENSFCYWLEHITRDLGSIVGGSSYKFGIYKRNSITEIKEESNRTTDGEYAWFKKYGEDTKEEAFKTVKSFIIRIAKEAQNGTLDVIDTIDLGNAYKWKIAFLYGDYNCVNMFKLDALRVIASKLEIDYNNKTPISYFHQAILKLKPEEEEYFTYCHALWQQYQERLIDVKKDFAKWLNVNTFESYRAYLGDTNKSIEKKLDEINNFFDDLDFFLVDPNNVNGLVSTILFLLSKKERIKNLDFVEYDSKNSNGIPKAILGKNNYIKFLKEKFDYVAPNYWIFQGNPKIFDFEAAMADGSLDNFTISAHKDKIKVGDKVIIWLSGAKAGCYALAEITSEPQKVSVSRDDKHWKVNDPNDTKAGIRIKHSLFDKPILWNEIKDYEEFVNFKGGNQGSNFSATEEEYNTLLNWHESENKKYWLYAPGEKAFAWDEFHDKNIMGLGWDEIGSIQQYQTKEDIFKALQTTYGGKGDKKNDVAANYDFLYNMNIGDIIIVKTGRTTLLGYGIVTSDYYFDDHREEYKHCRNVDWKLKGNWQYPRSLVLKTLTDITQYNSEQEGYDKHSDHILGIMQGEDQKNKKSYEMKLNSKNQILYGPPGTGKTFYLKEHLFEKYTIKETSISKEKYFEDTVSSLTWWQVIAIALIEIGTSRVNAILENRWVSKKANLSESKNVRATLWGTLQMHTLIESKTVAYTQRQIPFIFDKNDDKSWQLIESELKEQVPELYDTLDAVNNFKANPNIIIKHYDFVTFHQSFAYEDFIEGIKPVLPEVDGDETKDLGYTIEDGVFKNLCSKAEKDPDNRYAIFIDEINRGNVSAIFGELITLIETDKRLGAENELKIKLPYSKKEFGVPSNVDIYGTMNTADRSVEALDTALRRRFEFKEMMPDYSIIKSKVVEGIELSEVLETINQRIELLIDRDHTIGHSYFINVDSTATLARAFNNKIVPLLQEYFYGDYGKIGLVLGEGFVEKLKNDNIEFANFKYENSNDFRTSSYKLKEVNNETVIGAVGNLMGSKESASE